MNLDAEPVPFISARLKALMPRRRARVHVRRLAVVAIATALFTAFAVVPAAYANTYTVGTPSDTSNTACPSATATNCSLRQLILYVEANPSPPDTINVPSGTYVLNPSYATNPSSATFGALSVTASMTIVGAGAQATTIEETVPMDRSTYGDRVFDVSAPSSGSAPTVALAGMTISGGDANPNNGFYGGDIFNEGVMTLSDDWVTNGFACSGGGIGNVNGSMTIERSLISANQSACSSAGDDSGGIQNYGTPGTPDQPGRLVIDDSTIADNQATLGGGVFSWNDPGNTVQITNSTIADNTQQAEGSESVRSGGAGGLAVATGSAQVENTILAGNTSTASGAVAATNCGGTVTSLGHNLEDAATCQFAGPGDLSNTNPDLGPLQANGGPTDTFALAANTPAVGQVPGADCSPTDQRGVARPTTINCDIGAFELTPVPTPPATVTPPPPSVVVPVEVGAPSVSGTPLPGDRLTCNPGTWTGSPSFTYQWVLGTSPITGATARTYTVTILDEGQTITCEVAGHNSAGSATVKSAGVVVAQKGTLDCPKPSGSFNAQKIGAFALNETQAKARKSFHHYQVIQSGFDNFCLYGGWGIRGAYKHSRFVFLDTANPYYKLKGISPGDTLKSLAKKVKIGKVIVIGLNDWYVATGSTSNYVFKTRKGIVDEIGIALKRDTTGRTAQKRFLSSFKAGQG
jgi:hypothetical protein